MEDSILLISNLVCGVDSKTSVIGALTGSTNDAGNKSRRVLSMIGGSARSRSAPTKCHGLSDSTVVIHQLGAGASYLNLIAPSLPIGAGPGGEA